MNAVREESNAVSPPNNKPSVIFFGNGPLADYTLKTLEKKAKILFHARTKSDLETAARLKRENPDAFGILASFGIIIRPDFFELFEPEGIINLHPSLLPELRGASPIETAILSGANDFSYSIMKLAKAMDAGPLYHQSTLSGLPLDKLSIYQALATAGTNWILDHLDQIRSLKPTPQNDLQATFSKKFDKSMSFLDPESEPAETIFRKIVAFQGFPKPKYEFFGKTCIILDAHVINVSEIICDITSVDMHNSPLMLKCADRNFVAIDRLQPEGKKPMDAVSFVNGYNKNR